MPDDRRFPPRPIVGVGALLISDNRILLVERGHEPMKGYWSLPGGAVETGETLKGALRREILEETGLHAEVLDLLEVFERITPGADGVVEYHYVLLDYVCVPTGGTLLASDDASRAEWFTEDEVWSLRITEGTPAVIAKAFAWLKNERTQQRD